MTSARLTPFLFLAALSFSPPATALQITAPLRGDVVWRQADSPITIPDLTTIERGAMLTIEPGVEIRFKRKAGLIVYGDIHAVGNIHDSIRFTAFEGEEPGAWGGIHVRNPDSPKAYNDDFTSSGNGTVFDFCVFEFGGAADVENGSVLSFRTSASLVSHSTIRSSQGVTGTIGCLNSAEPVFVNCRIEGNIASRGGAISSGIGSRPQLINCLVIRNEATDNGGAVYLSLADAVLERCIIANNKAGSDGGALYAARSNDLRLTDNVLTGNRAGNKTNELFLTDLVTITLRRNTIEPVGTVIHLQKAGIDVDAKENYWGDPATVAFRELIRDRGDNRSEPTVAYNPALFAPSLNLPVIPQKISAIILCRTDDFAGEIPRGVAEGAPLRIRLDGVDANPFSADIIPVKVISALDPLGIDVALTETGSSTGVYTGRAIVASTTNQALYAIGDREGGEVTIFCPAHPDFRKSYSTLTPKPAAEDLTIEQIADLTHLTDHKPRFKWSYYEPVERPQKSFKVEVVSTDGRSVWAPPEVKNSGLEITYDGAELMDGESYTFELVVNSGKFWSEKASLSFRMNSLPTAPVPASPAEGALVPTRSPQVAAAVASDREGDTLTYAMELEDVSGGSAAQAVKGLTGKTEVTWKPPKQLAENGTYRFRVMAEDPFEPGPWGEYRLFYVNAQEEAPAAFDIIAPNSVNVFDLHPGLRWETASDPDPLSSVTYSIEVAKGGAWTLGRKYENISATTFVLPDSLENRAEYQWRITATDNTGRKTGATRSGKFFVETTPSIPELVSPLGGEERKPEAALRWKASTDPDPSDVITYDIEVFKGSPTGKPLAWRSRWSSAEISVGQLEGLESLADNTVYQWQVMARDNHNAASEYSGSGSFFFNKLNDAPGAPVAVTEPGETVTGTTSVTFGWKAGSDADQSDSLVTLVYEVEAAVGTFEGGDVRRFRSKPGATGLTGDVDDNKVWNYRVRTVDDEGATSAWVADKKVLVNKAEDPPAAFGLISPNTGAAVAELDSIRFTWSATSDPDWASSVRYRLEVTGPDGKVFKTETAATEYLYKTTLTNESDYKWSVTAIDNTNRETECSQSFTFHTNTTPSAPVLVETSAELLPGGKLPWEASSDPNPRDKLTYSLEVSAGEGFGSSLIKQSSLPHSVGTISSAINGLTGWEKLEDDKDYYYRVRATDNHGFNSAWSSAAKFRFNLANDAPGMPGGVYQPAGDIVVTDRSPVLKWSAASDEDLSDPPGTLVYEVRLDSDGELTKGALFDFSTPEGASEFRLPVPLTDNMPWVWSVRTMDDGGAFSAWTPMQSFLVNVQEEAPTMPALIRPYPGQTLNVLGPVAFGWSHSFDLDYKSSVTYKVAYGTKQDLSDAKQSGDLKDSTFTVTGPLENTIYYWRVTAKDNTGLETQSSTAMVTLDTRPTVPQPALPSGGVELRPDGRFAWSGSADPNPSDQIVYNVQISAEKDFGKPTVELKAMKETTVMLTAPSLKGKLADNAHYYWRVRATDNHGIESAWSSDAEFVYNEKNDAPSKFDLTSPAQGDSLPVGEVKMSWGAASDPDPGAKVTYTLQVARDKGFTDRAQRFSGLTTTEFTLPGAMTEAGAEFFWKVSAEDGMGGVTWGSGSDKTPWKFRIQLPPPVVVPPVEAPPAGTPGG